MKPLVFVETNFLIALLLPHQDFKEYCDAHALLEGNGGEYQLVIPFYSAFESLGTIRRKKDELGKWLVGVDRSLKNLRKSEKTTGDHAELIDQLKSYTETDFESKLNEYLDQLDVIHIDSSILHLTRDVINPLKIFSRGDAMDAYILASVLGRCGDIPMDVPKIFMSTNYREFSKVPQDLLDEYKIVYTRKFQFRDGMNKWNERYGQDA